MPTANVLHILDQAFFPKWLGVLRIWLDSPSVDLDEVARWYLRWKQCFPADLLQIQSVQGTRISRSILVGLLCQ